MSLMSAINKESFKNINAQYKNIHQSTWRHDFNLILMENQVLLISLDLSRF